MLLPGHWHGLHCLCVFRSGGSISSPSPSWFTKLQSTIGAQKNWGQQRLSEGCRPTGIHRIPLSEGLLWGQDSVICSAAWALLHLFTQLVRFWSLFLSEVCVCNWQWRFIRSLLMFEGKNLKSLKRKIQDELWSSFCGEIGYLADSEEFPKNAQGISQGLWSFCAIRAFSPLLHFMKSSFHTLHKWRHWLKEPFEDRISFLCLCGPRSWMMCSVILELAIWNLHCGASLPSRENFNTCHVYLVFIIWIILLLCVSKILY